MNQDKAKYVSIYLSSIIIAVVLVWLAFYLFKDSYDAWYIILLLLAGGIANYVFGGIWHELGHLLFGACAGFSFRYVKVGFFCVYKDKNKIRLKIGKLPSSVAGVTEMVPKGNHNLAKRFAMFAVGGIIFTFLVIGVALIIWILSLKKINNLYVYSFVCTALPYEYFLGVLNTTLHRVGGAYTDIGWWMGLAKKDPSCTTAISLLTIEGELIGGKTPSLIDAKLYFDLPQLPEDDVNFILLTEHRLAYYLDKEDYANAIKASDRLAGITEYAPDYYYDAILSEIIYCECVLKGGGEAERFYNLLERSLEQQKTVGALRARAAYAFYCLQNKEGALAYLSEAEKKTDDTGLGIYERKLLSRLREEIEK